MNLISFISDRIKNFFTRGEAGKPNETDGSEFVGREKVIVFISSIFLALCLWFIINLSRDFNVTINVPIQVVNIPEDVALSTELPDYVSVNLTGEGWQLIPLYGNPPRVNLSADSRQINLFEQMRNQVSAFSDLNVIQVDPIIIEIETEERITKRVPVRPRVSLNLSPQFGLVDQPVLTPDSITISGARSKLTDIDEWLSVEVEMNDVNRSIERLIGLNPATGGIRLEATSVLYEANISEFTESEVRIPIRTRNMPSGKAVTFNPSSITVRYDVPINRYSEVQGSRPFLAYVDYDDIERDTTGFITPVIEQMLTDINIRLRSYHPTSISYFNIITD